MDTGSSVTLDQVHILLGAYGELKKGNGVGLDQTHSRMRSNFVFLALANYSLIFVKTLSDARNSSISNMESEYYPNKSQ